MTHDKNENSTAPPRMTSVTIHYKGSSKDSLTSRLPPVKDEADQSIYKTIQSCLDPRIVNYISKIEINFEGASNDE